MTASRNAGRAAMAGARLAVCALVLAACGCAAKSGDSGFAAVQKAVLDRTGRAVAWDQDADADERTARAVHALLAGELTAERAEQVALLNDQSLQATFEGLGVARAEMIEAGLPANPSLTAEVRFPKYRALPFEFDVTQSLLDLLTLGARRRAAGAAFEAEQLRATQEVLDAAAAARAAFYRAQGSAQLVELRRTVLAAADASSAAAARLHEAGNITDLALANERALGGQARLDLARAERDALDAREELNAVLGAWGGDTAWTLAPRLPDVPEAEAPLEGLESLAVSRRADLAAARREADAAAQRVGLARYSALGPVNVGGHLEKESDGATTVGPAVEVPLPLFNQGQAAGSAAEARAHQAGRKFAALAAQARAQVRRWRGRMLAARDLAEYQRRVVLPLRHQIVQQTQLQLNAMQAGLFELLQARQSEIEAGRGYVEALQDYWLARTELERAVGGRLTGEQGDAPTRSSSTGPVGKVVE